VRAFFDKRDVLASVTLAAAASQLIHDLLKHKGTRSLFRGGEIIKPDRRNEFAAWFKSYENFLKHADRDPDARLVFRWEFVEFMLHAASWDYWMLTRTSTWPLHVFVGWAFANDPTRFVENEQTRPLFDCLRKLPAPIDKRLALEMLDAKPPDFDSRLQDSYKHAFSAVAANAIAKPTPEANSS
jgi:hypothetical protein